MAGRGCVCVVPCAVKLNVPQQIRARVQGDEVVVSVGGAEKIRWRDSFLPLEKGAAGIGVSSNAKVAFTDVFVTALAAASPAPAIAHTPNFSTRRFLGGRALSSMATSRFCSSITEASTNFVKLRPGYKPQLNWNSAIGTCKTRAPTRRPTTNGQRR